MTNRRMLAMCTSVATGVALTAVGSLGDATAGGQSSAPPPKVIQVSYGKSLDKPPWHRLGAYSRRTQALRFVARFRGRRAAAPAHYHRTIIDTDIKGEHARHPWRPIRDEGGRRVYRMVRNSLARRGAARLTIKARRGELVDKARVRIVLSECAMDPPIYPIECEVRVW